MNGMFEYCIRDLADRVDGQPVDDISPEDRSILQAAARKDYRGEGSYMCSVPNCVTRCTVEVVSGKIAVSNFSKVEGGQPCTDS